ncbi:caspase domain-containing protein [Crepidotus variabilis]|uniref:Caspase domain-containing protein n=1 Tax=Crepidotus variabilis TaxID=179855 RepID=A0A9P6ES73_9AGAR|nr:caspase domain-containing protein [Crepidotus variabilis]
MKIIGSRPRIRGKRRQHVPSPLAKLNEKENEREPEILEVEASPSVFPKFKKKALLIGVRQIRDLDSVVIQTSPVLDQRKGRRRQEKRRTTPAVLKGPHDDVTAVMNLLIETYKYELEDITVLVDDDEPDHVQPTRENILIAIGELVKDAREHDRFFFHFSGHSTQEDTDDIEEEDGKNEFILTSDNQTIKDDELRDYLVAPLPPKSSLIAVFDSCHSGSLLDLKHFRCNRVYVPWLNKGQRRTNSLWNSNKRQQAKVATRTVQEYRRVNADIVRWTKTSIDQLMLGEEEAAAYGVVRTPIVTKKKTSLSIVTESIPSPSWLDSPIQRCSSPEMLYCSGDCRDNPQWQCEEEQPDVISLSSSQDEQRTWEVADGSSMTQALVQILRQNPYPSLHTLLTLVSHDLHEIYLTLHVKAREYRKRIQALNRERAKKGKEPRRGDSVEMNNFQSPQLSSDRPLDLTRTWFP